MPKNVFWPAVLVIMGLVFLAANMQMLPNSLLNLWPIVFIVGGLGGLVVADRDDWMVDPKAPAQKSKPEAKKKTAKKSSTKRKSTAKKKTTKKKK